MIKLSIVKTRLIFVLFFLSLAIPSVVLSIQAYQQLRWQNLHQIRQTALEFTQRVDSALLQAVEKEEARSDTDYTFFVLAGSPEARFVQRSELSKYPVNSDLRGLLGYFQIDEAGNFSSPLLPSAYVQSEVVPSLYGISREENKQRKQLEQQIKQILSDNQLVILTTKGSTDSLAKHSDTSSLEEIQQGLASVSRVTSEPAVFSEEDAINERQQVDQVVEYVEGEMHTNAAKAERQRALQKRSNDNFYSAIEQKRKQYSEKIVGTGSRIVRENQLKKQVPETRKVRKEKNYIPQQSLLDEQSTATLIEPKDIKVKLFESEIEPYKFSLLESGHFVIYRQVWRNNKRIVQGAIISMQQFLSQYFGAAFQLSGLFETTELNVYFGNKRLQSWLDKTSSYSASSQANLGGEHLTKISLSEPFSQFSLDYKVVDMPAAAGASFVMLVACCLMIGLSIGTYLLYRLALKQSYLVQQQQDFVSSVSHELKTPLTSIRMYGEILKQGWVSDEKKMEYYDYIYSESERLSRLIANVLQISGVNHNALELKLEAVSVKELASLVRSKIDSQIEQSGFALNLTFDGALSKASVVVDRDAFIQVMINLVDNAIKYAGDGQRQRIDIRFVSVADNFLRISVRDYGPGISKQHMKRIFDLFYRSGDELTREVKGTGIGLALVKELAKAMSAEISARNRHPGVDFRIDFPLV